MHTPITNATNAAKAEANMAEANACVGSRVSGWAAGGKETLK